MLCGSSRKRRFDENTPPGRTAPPSLRSPLNELQLSPIRMELQNGTPYVKKANEGKLKLSIYVNSGHLTVHVVQARLLKSQVSDSCDSFVKLSISPDDRTRRTHCKTAVVPDSNHPLYDEKFSFELLPADAKKRILVSVWNRDSRKNASEFLGCMSFGVQHVCSRKRVVNGWYFLLGEDLGRRKHLHVPIREPTGETQPGSIPRVNADVRWMEPHLMIIKRADEGYGFSIAGLSPVVIKNVEIGSSADIAGLQRGDCIVRLNGLNVSRSTCESIAKLVRQSPNQVLLEVQRRRHIEYLDQSPRRPLSSTMKLRSPSSPGDDDSTLRTPRRALPFTMCTGLTPATKKIRNERV